MTIYLYNILTNTLDAYIVNGKIVNDRLIGGQGNDKIDGEMATTQLSADTVTIAFMEARLMMYLRKRN